MSRLLIAVIALSVLGYLAFRTLYGRNASVDADPQAPTEQLQDLRKKAKEIEVKEQRRVDDAERDSKLQE